MNAHATHGLHCGCHLCDPDESIYASEVGVSSILHRPEPMRPRGVVLKRDTRAAMQSASYSPHRNHRPEARA